MHRFTCHCCISMCMARESLHESSSRPKCSHVRSISKAGVFEHKVHIEYLCICEAGIFEHKVHIEYLCICEAGIFEHKVHIEYYSICEAGVFEHKVHMYNVRLEYLSMRSIRVYKAQVI